MKRMSVLLSFLLFVLTTVVAQNKENFVEIKKNSKNRIFNKLGKAPRIPAFQSEGYWVWGSSVVKSPDGKYHMYVSRFPKSLPFHPGWMVASEIVHAVSDNIEGPYTF